MDEPKLGASLKGITETTDEAENEGFHGEVGVNEDKLEINTDEPINEKSRGNNGEEGGKETEVVYQDNFVMAGEMDGDDLESDPSLDTFDYEDDEEYNLPPQSSGGHKARENNVDDDEGSEEDPSEEESIDEEDPSEEESIDEEDPSEEKSIDEEDPSEEESIDEEDPSEEESIDEDDPIEEEFNDQDDPKEEEFNDESASKGDASEEGDAKNAEGDDETLEKDGEESVGHHSKQIQVKPMDMDKSSKIRKKVEADKPEKIESLSKPEPSHKINGKAKVTSKGMIFFCSSKTKDDCFRYKVLGMPETKKHVVEKIYKGMFLFLYDVDLKLMYGIFKAAGPGGYDIVPNAFRSQFPSQVRYTVLDDCFPVAEEKFKKVIKKNYFTKTKFDCQLNYLQVRQLCKLFISSNIGPYRTKPNRFPRAAKHRLLTARDRSQSERTGQKRRLAPREHHPRHERPHKRTRKNLSSPCSPPTASYAYERACDADSYRRDAHRRPPYRGSREPLIIERQNSYGDGVREPHVSRRDSYRGARETYTNKHDRCRDGRDSYMEPRSDPYKGRRKNSFIVERDDPYGDMRVSSSPSHTETRDPYMDRVDCSYVERHAMYHDEPYDKYKREPIINDTRGGYRDAGATRVVEYGCEYRRGEPFDRVESRLSSPETRRRDESIERDPRVLHRESPTQYSESKSIYSVDYHSRSGSARHYHL